MDLESITLTLLGASVAATGYYYLRQAQDNIDSYVAKGDVFTIEFGAEIAKFSLCALGMSLGAYVASFEILYQLSL